MAASMKCGVIITGGPVHEQVVLAQAAEGAGWDGVFTWDGIHVGDDMEVHDPWVLMAAFAMTTERVRLGAMIQALARRRPWKVARESATLDRLSDGRLVLCVGLGAVDDSGFGRVGEIVDRRTRAERLGESLEFLVGLWSGERFGFEGRHYRFEPMAFRPSPVQRPRIPIWVVGAWPSERSMRRVVRYDGVLPNFRTPSGGIAQATPLDALRAMRDWLDERTDDRRLDIVVESSPIGPPGT
jgi:alkanesulfonate monooxygenase SsuD/methylene tetrahydromethanopterin reductase-like flavin-dependent oxidoreductase (luciferase family)